VDLRKLEVFYYVYKTSSFSKAGEEVFLSQPTISAHIHSLEEELGLKLFERKGKTVLPTPAGRVLFAKVEKIFSLLKQTEQELEELKNNIGGCVVLGASTIPANYLLPRVLKEVWTGYPKIAVSLEVADSFIIWNKVLAGKVDFGVVGASYGDELEAKECVQDEVVIVARRDVVANKFDSLRIDLSGLSSLDWIVREKGSGTRKILEAGLKNVGMSFADLNVRLEVNTSDSLLKYVLAGVGVGFSSHWAVQELLDRGELVELKVDGLKMRRSFYLVYHKLRRDFPLTNRLQKLILTKLKEISLG